MGEQLALEKYALFESTAFQALVADLSGNPALLKKFAVLVDQLDSGSVRDCKTTLFEIAKHHNKFGGVDSYMRELARIILDTDRDLVGKLEQALNTELAITKKETPKMFEKPEVHPNVLAQPDFAYLSPGEKFQRIEEYRTLVQELDRTRHLKHSTKFTDSFDELFAVLDSLDTDNLGLKHLATFERLQKTRTVVDDLIGDVFERFGHSGITYSSIDTVYSEKVSGIQGLAEVKASLIQNGMSGVLADQLEQRWLTRCSKGHVCTMMDLFSCPKAKAAFNAATLEDIHLNFASR